MVSLLVNSLIQWPAWRSRLPFPSLTTTSVGTVVVSTVLTLGFDPWSTDGVVLCGRFHVLPIPAWISSGYYRFLPTVVRRLCVNKWVSVNSCLSVMDWRPPGCITPCAQSQPGLADWLQLPPQQKQCNQWVTFFFFFKKALWSSKVNIDIKNTMLIQGRVSLCSLNGLYSSRICWNFFGEPDWDDWQVKYGHEVTAPGQQLYSNRLIGINGKAYPTL